METDIPENLLYTEEHEWIDPETGWMGITDFAQEELGDIVYVELPDVGDDVEAMDSFMIIESVKAVSDVYSPVNGTIEEVNDDVQNQPETVNESPYDDGKFAKIDVESGIDDLMDSETYADIIS